MLSRQVIGKLTYVETVRLQPVSHKSNADLSIL